jgi:hypothetical protein
MGPQLGEHFWLYVVCVYDSGRSDHFRDANTIESGPSPDIADRHAGFKIELSNAFFGLFFFFALFPIQPASAANAHNGGNLSASGRVNRLSIRGVQYQTGSNQA